MALAMGSAMGLTPNNTFGMYDAMCPGQDWKDGPSFAMNNVNAIYSIENVLHSSNKDEYDLICIRWCLAKLNTKAQDNCCGWSTWEKSVGGDGNSYCRLFEGESDDLMYNRGNHRAIKIGNEAYQQVLYNFTLSGWVDLGFNEISASSANDTVSYVEITVYPDGDPDNGTPVHVEHHTDTEVAPGNYMPIEASFYILPQSDTAYAEINLGGNFDTEQANAVNATFNTVDI